MKKTKVLSQAIVEVPLFDGTKELRETFNSKENKRKLEENERYPCLEIFVFFHYRRFLFVNYDCFRVKYRLNLLHIVLEGLKIIIAKNLTIRPRHDPIVLAIQPKLLPLRFPTF